MNITERKSVEADEGLVVALDFAPADNVWMAKKSVKLQVLRFTRLLRGTGVYIKLESALRGDYDLMPEIHKLGLKIFADLKLYGTPKTLALDGKMLKQYRPEILTVSCQVGVKGMLALKQELPETELVGVTTLTTLDEKECEVINRRSILKNTIDLFLQAKKAGLDGVVCGAKEIPVLRQYNGVTSRDKITFNTPDIRPEWSVVENDDQNPERMTTPREAFGLGATRIIVGRPITEDSDPYEAVMRIIGEK